MIHAPAAALPRLGARPAVVRPHQPRLDRLPMMARMAPATLPRRDINPSPILGDNDQIGDCTAVGIANAMRAVSALNGFQTAVTTRDVVRFYSASTGYDPTLPATDRGGIETDVLAFAAERGFALDSQTLYPVWGTVDPDNANSLRLCTAALGVTYLGVELAVADQAGIGGLWDTPATGGDQGDPTPGSWGGHCLLLWAYDGTADTDTVTLLTWGKPQRATWRWLRSRLMEAHGLLWPQLAAPKGNFLSVADLETIRAANRSFLSGVSA